MNEEDAQAGLGAQVAARATVLDWLREGARVAALREPRWQGLEARPVTLLWLVVAASLVSCAMEWALTPKPATLDWHAFLTGWMDVVITLWLCWIVARSRQAHTASAATLTALLWAATLGLTVLGGVAMAALEAVAGPRPEWRLSLQWLAWGLPLAWSGLTQVRLLWRVAGTGLARGATLLLTGLSLAVSGWLAPPANYWSYDAASAEAEGQVQTAVAEGDHTYKGLPLTEAVVAAQPLLLADALAAVRPPEPGRVNVFALTYAPYASEDVFMRESAVVAKAMRERFGAGGRIVELVNNPASARRLPWAMPTNLHKAIQHMAAVMDRDRDVLFLHLTSHGGADGVLAADSWPLETGTMTPQLLKRWLDEAGVKWRVVSISACYSGSWVAPLAGEGTLVMTAADADHTSYGCGRRSPLTFFGQAMYVDALYETRSFIAAHAQARRLIEKREVEAGKKDGYSNPQIRQGDSIRRVLEQLERELNGG